MSSADHLAAYAQGLSSGDAATILGALSDDYVLDDPNAGRIAKADFAAYYAAFLETVAALRGAASEAPFMELTEVVTSEVDGILTAWCWWAVPGTDIQGGGLIKAGKDGILSERLTYYTALAG